VERVWRGEEDGFSVEAVGCDLSVAIVLRW
jgi:hypothetical protein